MRKTIYLLLGILTLCPLVASAQDISRDSDSLLVSATLSAGHTAASTAAISTASGTELYKSPVSNLSNSFSGRLPGLVSIGGNGAPGYGTAKMLVRGIGSYARPTGTNTLKFYVDGFEVQSGYVEFLSPEEIESVSVFKDAAALSTFGMNGANGVMWIQTKRGGEGAPVISFQTRSGIQAPINVAKPLNSYEYAYYFNQAASNDNDRNWSPAYDDTQLNAYYDGNGVDVNWYDEIYRKFGTYCDAVLSMRGGSKLARYFVVLDYANQQGLFNVRRSDRTSNLSFAKYGIRTNLDMQLGKILKVSLDLGGRLEDRTRPNYDIYALTQDVLNYPSNIYPIFDEAANDPISKFSGTATHPNNPLGSLTGLGWVTSRTKFMQANFNFREDLSFLLDGLYAEEAFSFYSRTVGTTGKTRTYARYYGGVAQTSDQSTYIRSNPYGSAGMERWLQGRLTLGYSRTVGKHAVNVSANSHISDYAGDGDAFYNWKYRYANFFGRANYTYDSRYAAELGFSYFGSDAYAPGKRFVFYPTAALAWTASNEEFLKDARAIDYLKIRTSAGFSGATEATVNIDGFNTDGRYLYQQYYTSGGGFVQGYGPAFGWGASGFVPMFTANPDVTAEKSLKLNLGFDAGILQKIGITADYFIDYRSGILTLDNSLMNYYGNQYYYANIGQMLNQGVDANFSFSDKAGDLGYTLFGNLLFAVNKVLEMGEISPKYAYNAATEQPLGVRMGLECIGFYDQKDFNLDGSLKSDLPQPLFGAVQAGDLKFKDQDGDNFIDETDIVKIGNPSYPKWNFSFGGDFTYKGFDLSVLFTGNAGGTVNMMDYSQWRPFINYGNIFPWAANAWAFYPEQGIDTRADADFPRLTTEQNDNNYRSSSFWIVKNNSLRLRNLELGYEFAGLAPVKNAGISKCRLYISAYNLVTISKLLSAYDMDPDTADYSYPAVKSVNLGIQITF